MFEPKADIGITEINCGMMVSYKDTDNSSVIMDASGKIIAELTETKVSPYSDNTALVKESGKALYYIDKLGKKLF
ncbi:MAG: hypothetical protein FWD58_09015 [Firmicutes bacterium]|nr:hypothetical protein [Bacillota bacterium]